MEIEREDASFKKWICFTKKTYLHLPFEVRQKNPHSTYNFMHGVILPQLSQHSAHLLAIYRIFHIKQAYEMTLEIVS